MNFKNKLRVLIIIFMYTAVYIYYSLDYSSTEFLKSFILFFLM